MTRFNSISGNWPILVNPNQDFAVPLAIQTTVCTNCSENEAFSQIRWRNSVRHVHTRQTQL